VVLNLVLSGDLFLKRLLLPGIPHFPSAVPAWAHRMTERYPEGYVSVRDAVCCLRGRGLRSHHPLARDRAEVRQGWLVCSTSMRANKPGSQDLELAVRYVVVLSRAAQLTRELRTVASGTRNTHGVQKTPVAEMALSKDGEPARL
jgi:hypothetical protein